MSRRWLVVSALLVFLILFWVWREQKTSNAVDKNLQSGAVSIVEPVWTAPDSNSIPLNDSGKLIRYGKRLISATSSYFGPHGSISHATNGMNCQNCHLNAGTKAFGGSFGSVAAVFPRFSERRGSFETINQRITDCFERSMNGTAPDSNSLEMKAMSAYIRWVGKDVRKGKKPRGTGLEILAYIQRSADPEIGKQLYIQKCQLCHGLNGEGKPDSLSGFLYPPLWGDHSYNSSAGLYRLTKFSGFIKDNMPYGSSFINEQLSTEEAWDLAAFVNSQPRPVKKFKQDWPDVMLKPADVPEGPFPDSFPSVQHKYGPFAPIARYKKDLVGRK
jgi:thiosulfate dehydrogenase